jgi:large subunit ribosomal protein L13
MENTKSKIHTIDAEGKSLGRLATQISILLRGKNNPEYLPNVDQGQCVQVNNVSRIKLDDKKAEQKKYYRYSGYPSGLKTTKMKDEMIKKPTNVLRRAVKQMLPDNKMREIFLKRLIIKS